MSLSCNFCNKKDRSPCSFIRYDGFFAEFLYLNDDDMPPWLRQELQFHLKITLIFEQANAYAKTSSFLI